MTLHLRYAAGCCAALACVAVLSFPAAAQNAKPTEEYVVKPLPPGGPPPRLANGRPDFSGHWLPNGAGQGVSGRFGVDPAARGRGPG